MKKIGIIYDIAKQTSTGETIGWAYYLRAIGLQKYCPDDMEIEVWQTNDPPWERVNEFDLIFNIEYAAPDPRKYRKKGFDGPWVLSFNSDSRRRHRYWPPAYQNADWIICNNQEVFDFHRKSARTCCISNGYDLDLWYPEVPIEERPHKLLWCGSSGPTKGKRYQETFVPLEKLAKEHGFETDFRPIDDIDERIVKTYADQRAWYSSGSYILCASQSEGTPGFFGEGVACGCVGVTVRVGNSQEWLNHGENGMFCNHTPESFIESLLYARENRSSLSVAGMNTIHNDWAYGGENGRAQYFYQLFRRLIDDGAKSIKPFSFLDTKWGEI